MRRTSSVYVFVGYVRQAKLAKTNVSLVWGTKHVVESQVTLFYAVMVKWL